ncbi:MAG TPA: glycosyltransferase family 39 protein [Thermoanaerobaculia bacterium]
MTNRRADVAAIALIVIAMIRIATTWTVFSATIDEPMHLSAGLQIYKQHAFTLQQENPPLPRVVLAFAPWIGGVELKSDITEQLRLVFFSNDRYKTNLVLARCGNLVFFAIAAFAVWSWSRRELGSAGGLLAVLLFTMQPVIFGFAGLGTHDMPATAGFALALAVFARWLDTPDAKRAALFGAAFGFAVLCKFSNIGYVPAACLAMTIVRMIADRNARGLWRRMLPSFAIALAATLFVIWTGYGFTIDAFIGGIRKLAEVDRLGHKSYLLGELRTTGWWYYFPIALALKTTLASLVLAIAALFAKRQRVAGEALAAVAAILLVAMPSHLNLGIRYVLPLYAPLSIAAAAAALTMLRSTRPLRIAAIVLLAWHCGASLLAHPDGFAYFNEAAGREPWTILNDSNIDWGQDVLRLREVAREEKIASLTTSIASMSSIDDIGLPQRNDLQVFQPLHGWVAVSEYNLAFGRGISPEIRTWVDAQFESKPYRRVGKSIRLYHFP